MRRFKVTQGAAEVHDLTKEIYEKAVANKEKYSEKGKDDEQRFFAICPACDNPIQIIGLYKKLKNTDRPYGRHYNRDTKIAPHDEQAYQFCPYATRAYGKVTPDMRRKKLTDFERSIYYCVRDNFDLAIYIMKQDTGIFITESMAKNILREYLCARGYMYYWATLYNIPWMLMYFTRNRHCFGLLVRNNSELHQYLSTRQDVELESKENSNYALVKNKGQFLNLGYATILHDRKVINDEVRETIQLIVSDEKKDGTPRILKYIPMEINEYRFMNLTQSPEAQKYRNQRLLDYAKELMPDLEN